MTNLRTKKVKELMTKQVIFQKYIEKEKCVCEYHVTYMVLLLPAERPPYTSSICHSISSINSRKKSNRLHIQQFATRVVATGEL